MKPMVAILASAHLVAMAALDAQQRVAAASALTITRSGTQEWRPAGADNFTGAVRVQPLFNAAAPARAYGASVSFDPGARTAWHSHSLGQTLIVTAGVGRVQQRGGEVEDIRPGDVVWTPPGVQHWHGASPNAAMTHTAISENSGPRATEWMEKVTDAQYAAPVRGAAAERSRSDSAAPSRAQQLMGDITPKLAELTDSVLFGDVWARPGLTRRDRSLVTVSALIAMNRPDQLRSHLTLARTNGVTRDELVEAITHLAFYAGWPNALTAVGVAREVLTER